MPRGVVRECNVRLGMSGIVFYFQLHQPFRLRRYSVFDVDGRYFDDKANADICRKVADKCYRPATQMLLDLARQWGDRFQVALSVTGTLLEQLEQFAPDVITMVQELVRSGSCELLAETSHHSLTSLFWPEEFIAQVERHERKLASVFGVHPRVFRNTELICSNDIARLVASMKAADGSRRYAGMFAEAATPALAAACSKVHAPSGVADFGLLLRNSSLSDDLAFRFGSRPWPHWPLTPAKYASWLIEASRHGLADVCIDFETFGEHQWAETGIFRFFRDLPGEVFAQSPETRFLSPSAALASHAPEAVADMPSPTSWADASRDVTAWRGNAMQVHALDELHKLGRAIRESLAIEPADSPRASHLRDMERTWRLLSTSDHFYYMSTKGAADGAVHAYFRAFDSPYEAYIAFMNAIRHLAHGL